MQLPRVTGVCLIILMWSLQVKAAGWSCSFDLEGDSSKLLVFTAASIHCRSDEQTSDTNLTLSVDASLMSFSSSFTGTRLIHWPSMASFALSSNGQPLAEGGSSKRFHPTGLECSSIEIDQDIMLISAWHCAGVHTQESLPSNTSTYTPLLSFGPEASSITIKDSRFMNVAAQSDSSSPTHLDSLIFFNMSDGVTVSNLTVINCTVSGQYIPPDKGQTYGLLTFMGSHTGPVSISNSSFDTTSQAIAATDGSFLMANTAFDNVTTVMIMTTGADFVSIDKCNFTNGGRLYIYSPNVTVNHSMFVNNTVLSTGYNSGGALCIESQPFDPKPDFSLKTYSYTGIYTVGDCSFVNNFNTGGDPMGSVIDQGTEGFGGALLLVGSQGDANEAFIIQNCSFHDNSAVAGAGIGTWGMANVLISSCDFQCNFASSGAGAAVYTFGLQPKLLNLVHVEYCIVTDSLFGSADTGNCDVRLESCHCASVQSSHFLNSLGTGLCIVDVVGGRCDEASDVQDAFQSISFFLEPRFDGYESDSFIGDFTLNNAISVHVTASEFASHTSFPMSAADPFVGGAGLRLESLPVSLLTNLVFRHNSARQGAALHLKACDKTVLQDSSFVNNTASHEGGSIALVDTGEKGLLIGGTNITNSSALSGGAVYGGPGTAMIVTNGSRLTGSTAASDGGAVYCNGCQSFALTDSAEVWENEALGSGGGCYFDACVLLNLTAILLHDNRYGFSHITLSCFHSVLCRS